MSRLFAPALAALVLIVLTVATAAQADPGSWGGASAPAAEPVPSVAAPAPPVAEPPPLRQSAASPPRALPEPAPAPPLAAAPAQVETEDQDEPPAVAAGDSPGRKLLPLIEEPDRMPQDRAVAADGAPSSRAPTAAESLPETGLDVLLLLGLGLAGLGGGLLLLAAGLRPSDYG